MKFDNYETLTATAKMLTAQEDVKNSAPFVMAVAKSKGSNECAAILAATGKDAFGLIQSIMGGLAKELKNQGAPVSLVMDEFAKSMLNALADGYGVDAVGECIANTAVNLTEKDEEDE